MNTVVKIIGLVGSIRSNHNHLDELSQIIHVSADLDTLLKNIKACPHVFSNTDIAVAAALMGAKSNGAAVEIISLVDLFRHRSEDLYKELDSFATIDDLDEIDTLSINDKALVSIMQSLTECHGIILGSPVYFGDRSSVANKILQLTGKSDILKDKAFGSVATGAKRNGGQETTIIYTLYEAILQGAVAVGNGPKTAQYGGTVYAGDVGKAVEDVFGMDTSFGTGRQVAQLAKIIQAGTISPAKRKPKTLFLVTMDNAEKKYQKTLEDYIKKQKHEFDHEVVNLTTENIYRCIACSACPSPALTEKYKDQENPYTCVVQTSKDNMKYLREKMVDVDVIVLVGVNTNEPLTYRYQAFMERTRFIRRNDFELTNKIILSLNIEEVGATKNNIFDVKAITSFIRHNTVIVKPLQLIFHKGKILVEPDFAEYFPIFDKIVNGRFEIDPFEVSYKATGYDNKTLDHTAAIRR
ncbi:MAG: NAD(P)H-dependent oxidoreductase [Leptospirales bacterium]